MQRRDSGSRRRGIIALTAVSLLLVPAAIAWACNPQAQLVPNKASFSPGETMKLSGSFFPGSTPIAISGPGISTTVTTTSNGAFSVSVTVPSTAGNYSVRATKADGSARSGLPKVASFQVASSTAAPAPVTGAPAPTTTQGRTSPSFSEPGVVRSPTRSVARGTQPRSSQPRSSQPTSSQPRTGGVAGGGTVVTGVTGVPVFAGSVAPAQATFAAPAPAAAAKGTTARKGSTATSGRTAASESDVWSGFAPSRTASLTADTAGAPDSGSGSSLGLGIGLLALGLLALAAGLTAAEVQRRRAVR